METVGLDEEVEAASRVADQMANQARVTVRELDRLDELAAASDLFTAVWSAGADHPPLTQEALRAISHAGGYVAGAFAQDRLLGSACGFLGMEQGELFLHSHILGVLPDLQGRHVGLSLKHHQRTWALTRGIRTIRWTFDPLVRKNAHFNIARLGASARHYYARFYGDMHDGINQGDEADRLLATWELDSSRARAAASGATMELDAGICIAEGAQVLLDVGLDGEPVPATLAPPASRSLLCRVPADVLALRRDDPDTAIRWREAVRAALGGAIEGGFVVTGVSRDGWYLLESTGRE